MPSPPPEAPSEDGDRRALRLPGQTQIGLGAAVAVMGVSTVALGGLAAGLPLLVFGSLVAGAGVVARASGTGGRVLDAAYGAIVRGRTHEGEALLAVAEASWQPASVRRAIDLQRGLLDFRRGDLHAARARAEAAVRRPLALAGGAEERSQVAAVVAFRALVRVAGGDSEGARADIAAVLAMPEASPEALARAAVAEAMVLERAGDREALAGHLRGPCARLADDVAPRERAILRAYRRMLEASRTSVYREGASRESDAPAPVDSATDAWVATLAPAAAPFMRRVARGVGSESAAMRESSLRAASFIAAQAPAQAQANSMLFWVLSIGFFAGVWKVFRFSGPAFPAQISVEIAAVAIAIMVALVASTRRRALADDEFAVALSSLARGKEGAVAALQALTDLDDVVTAARAWLALGRGTARTGDLEAADRQLAEGVALVDRDGATRGVAMAAGVWSELVAEHAWVAAARGDTVVARRDLELLEDATPEDPLLPRAELRVALLDELGRGELEAAAARAAATPDTIPLTVRDEALLEIVTAVVRPAQVGATETQRMRREIAADPELSRWLERAAPDLMRAFYGSRIEVRTDVKESAEDEDAESEVAAEEAAVADAGHVARSLVR